MKKQSSLYQIVFVLLLLVALVSCTSALEPVRTTEVPAQTPTPTLTESPPTSTVTKIPPTSTDTPEPTTTSTATKTLTATSTATLTYTPEPALLTLNNDTVCMTGASFGHNVHQYMSAGTEHSILGQLSDHSWWLVGADNEASCWIYRDYATVSGNIQALPLITPPLLPSETPTVTPESPGIYYILIAKDTGGPFGCGDSLIRYYPGVWVKGDMEDDIKGALNALFANHKEYTNGLYNPIYKSDIKAKSVDEIGGDVIVRLAGQFVRPKDTCESQRMHAQVWYTVSQFSPVRAVIYMNNALLGDLLEIAK